MRKRLSENRCRSDRRGGTRYSKLSAFVAKEIRKDGEVVMDPEDINLIVKGELEYEESVEDIF